MNNIGNSSFHAGFLSSKQNPMSIKEEITSTTSSIRSRNHPVDFQYTAPGLASVVKPSNLGSGGNLYYGDHLQGLSSLSSGNLIKGLDQIKKSIEKQRILMEVNQKFGPHRFGQDAAQPLTKTSSLGSYDKPTDYFLRKSRGGFGSGVGTGPPEGFFEMSVKGKVERELREAKKDK